MKLIIEVNKEDLDFLRKTFTQNSHDYIPMVIKNRFTDAVLNGTPIPDNATNGEVFGKIMDCMFMDNAYIATDKHGYLHLRGVKDDWWNSPYQKGGK